MRVDRGISSVGRWVDGGLKRGVLLLIRAYQLFVSPLMPRTCMYHPSCSQYAAEAFGRYGFWRATRLALGRLFRCWPWVAGGDDPVP